MIDLKKVLLFCLSLALSVILFAAVTVTSVLVSVDDKENTSQEPKPQAKAEPVTLEALLIYDDTLSDVQYAALVTVDLQSKTVISVPLRLETDKYEGKTLEDIYKNEGFYPFVNACKGVLENHSLKYVKINSNTFVTIADRTKKIVYNDKNEGKILLTGRQAAEKLSEDNFAFFFEQMATNLSKSNIKEEFLFTTKLCENDLSYPLLCTKLEGY